MRYKIVLFLVVYSLLSNIVTLVQSQEVNPCESYEPLTKLNVNNLSLVQDWEILDLAVSAATISNNGNSLAVAYDNTGIQLLDMVEFNVYGRLTYEYDHLTFLMFDESDRFLLGGSTRAKNYQLWDLETNTSIQEYDFGSEVWSDVDSQLHIIATLSNENDLKAYNLLGGEEVFRLSNVQNPVLSSDGKLVAVTNSDGYIEVWNIESHAILYTFERPFQDGYLSYGFNPVQGLFWVSWDTWNIATLESFVSFIQFWNLDTGELAFTIGENGNQYIRMSFNQSGDLAVIGGVDGLVDIVWLYNISEQRLLGSVATTGGGDGTINPNSDLIVFVAGTGPYIYIHSVETFDLLRLLDIGSGSARPAQFSNDGRFLLTQGSDIQLWGVLIDTDC
jgi:WD40 repeat protein